jgi:hypothetical protein
MCPEPDVRRRSRGSALLAMASVALGLSALEAAAGCGRGGKEKRAEPAPSADPIVIPASSARPTLPREVLAAPRPSTSAAALPAPSSSAWPGPWFVVTRAAAGVSSEPSFEGDRKLGYVRSGGKIPVKAKPMSGGRCSAGWYEVVGGGFVCGNLGTTDPANPDLKLVQHTPNLDEVLPYQYARNAKNGTPLYRSVPTPEQMDHYEPYRVPAKKAKTERGSGSPGEADAEGRDGGRADSRERAGGDAGSDTAQDAGAAPEVPWWQRDGGDTKLNEVTLNDLHAEADDVLSMRMVQGFYVAIDRTFRWNDRTWYKTTKGLVAPADRFWQVQGPTFKGVELDGATWKLPVAWVYGGRKSSSGYGYDEQSKALKPSKTFEAFVPIALSGNRRDISGTSYYETTDGLWVKVLHVRVARVADPPEGTGPNERWLDVNLSEQSLVAYEGTRPVYATLVSTGKKSPVKEKDHSTPTGQWRVREKHVTTTMDGDGTAAGDLPYSIEDVPYVVYFHQSYAVHGAFWHKNFGVKMSHGCINLSPLDAKRVFFFVDPPLPVGWHGVWSSSQLPGSRVVVHE